jgi:hypothetical protein
MKNTKRSRSRVAPEESSLCQFPFAGAALIVCCCNAVTPNSVFQATAHLLESWLRWLRWLFDENSLDFRSTFAEHLLGPLATRLSALSQTNYQFFYLFP